MSIGEVLITVAVRVREWLPRLPGRMRGGWSTIMTEPSAMFRSPAIKITLWLVGFMVLVGVLIKLSPLVLPAKFYGN